MLNSCSNLEARLITLGEKSKLMEEKVLKLIELLVKRADRYLLNPFSTKPSFKLKPRNCRHLELEVGAPLPVLVKRGRS